MGSSIHFCWSGSFLGWNLHFQGPWAKLPLLPAAVRRRSTWPGSPGSRKGKAGISMGFFHVFFQDLGAHICELQPKFKRNGSSIRDVFIFWKLSWGLENDNTLFTKTIFPKPEKRSYTLFKNWWLGAIYCKYWRWPMWWFWRYREDVLKPLDFATQTVGFQFFWLPWSWSHGMFRVMFRIPFLDKTWQNHISRAFFGGWRCLNYFSTGGWETKRRRWWFDRLTQLVSTSERSPEEQRMGIAIEIEGITTQTEVDCGKQHAASITLLTNTLWHVFLKVDFPLINGWYGLIHWFYGKSKTIHW